MGSSLSRCQGILCRRSSLHLLPSKPGAIDGVQEASTPHSLAREGIAICSTHLRQLLLEWDCSSHKAGHSPRGRALTQSPLKLPREPHNLPWGMPSIFLLGASCQDLTPTQPPWPPLKFQLGGRLNGGFPFFRDLVEKPLLFQVTCLWPGYTAIGHNSVKVKL